MEPRDARGDAAHQAGDENRPVPETRGLVTIGPRTTVHALLTAYPFLRRGLSDLDPAFAPLDDARRAVRWARVTSLSDVAVSMDITWQRLVRDLRGRIEAELGETPPAAGSGAVPPQGDRRLAELRAIAGELEHGGSLLELAGRVRSLTAGITAADAAALDQALGNDAEHTSDAVVTGLDASAAAALGSAPRGHPLDTQWRSGRQLRLLAADLRTEVRRMGGSPSRRRWALAKPMVQRLVERMAALQTMFGRHARAWFPALAARGVQGLGSLLADREAEALELLRRLRLAVERDDAAFVAVAGARLAELVDDVLNTVDLVLVPLAERHLRDPDWREVREREDAVGYELIAPPPPWPPPA